MVFFIFLATEIEREGVGKRKFPVWGDPACLGLEGGSPIERIRLWRRVVSVPVARSKKY
jgi:hypothetical protein